MKMNYVRCRGKIDAINQGETMFALFHSWCLWAHFYFHTVSVCPGLHTHPTPPPVMACNVFLISLKNDGVRLHPSVSLTTQPPAAETYITLIGWYSSNICHHVAFMDQQRRLFENQYRNGMLGRGNVTFNKWPNDFGIPAYIFLLSTGAESGNWR